MSGDGLDGEGDYWRRLAARYAEEVVRQTYDLGWAPYRRVMDETVTLTPELVEVVMQWAKRARAARRGASETPARSALRCLPVLRLAYAGMVLSRWGEAASPCVVIALGARVAAGDGVTVGKSR